MSATWLFSANDAVSSALQSIQAQRQSLANAAIGSGAAFLQQHKYDLALKAFQQADAISGLGFVYLQTRRLEQAADQFHIVARG